MMRFIVASCVLIAPISALLLPASSALRPLTPRRCSSPLLAAPEEENLPQEENNFSVDWDRYNSPPRQHQ